MGHADSKELNHSVKGNDETSEDLEVEKMKGGGGGGPGISEAGKSPLGLSPQSRA